MRTLRILGFCLFALVNARAAPGVVVLFNGTSSAGKSSLAEAMIKESKTPYEVVSFDGFLQSYREKHPRTRLGNTQYRDVMVSMYQHVKEQSKAGTNIIIDTVEFDVDYDRYCAILDCTKVIKAIVYCPLQHILQRVEKRNSSNDPSNRRPVLLSFQQFVQMYKRQTSPDDLVVEKTTTKAIRLALVEAGAKARNPKQYAALYQEFVQAFGIDQDKDIVIVTKGKYDLVLNTKASTKKENIRILETHRQMRR